MDNEPDTERETIKLASGQEIDAKTRQFVAGTKAGPGRKLGARNKLSESFMAALLRDFDEHGVQAVETVRCNEPSQYLKIIASILPKQAEIQVSDYDDLGDDELRAALSGAIRDLESFGINLGAEDGEGETIESQARQSKPLQTIQ